MVVNPMDRHCQRIDHNSCNLHDDPWASLATRCAPFQRTAVPSLCSSQSSGGLDGHWIANRLQSARVPG